MTGFLAQGRWRSGWHDTGATGGRFVRPDSGFRARVSADGATGFAAEPGRYHLYVSLACPWAHRALLMRALKGLEEVVPVSIVEPVMDAQGWAFSEQLPDRANGFAHLHEAYTAARGDYSGRVVVPVLWDTQARTIVNNESSDIVRMFNREFDAFTAVRTDYRPAALAAQIDAINAFVYDNVNDGVYRCGFASSQAAYDTAFDRLFGALDRLEQILSRQRFLVGERPTEADWRLFATLVRFDAVYHGHFKCNRNRLADFHHLSNYVRDLYEVPGVAATVNLDHVRRHYYMSHPHLNPSRVVARGPLADFGAPHDRGRLA